jgi:large subunit ribosomal protein L18
MGVRNKISGTAERPRLSVFRSNKQISAQLIDDVKGITLASASSLEKELVDKKEPNKTEMAKLVGERIASKAKGKGIGTIVFDRKGYRYHGRVKALAEGARKGGLKF